MILHEALAPTAWSFFRVQYKLILVLHETEVPFLFIICLLLIQIKQFHKLKNYDNVNIIDMFPFQVLPQTIGLVEISKLEYIYCVNSVI